MKYYEAEFNFKEYWHQACVLTNDAELRFYQKSEKIIHFSIVRVVYNVIEGVKVRHLTHSVFEAL